MHRLSHWDFTDTEQRYDVVLDALGGETATRSVGVLRPGGVLVSLVPWAEDTRAHALGETGDTTGKLVITVR